MRYDHLSLDKSPPISVPLRFFLTAPLFGVGFGLALLITGPTALESRWMPATLGITHLLTLGFLTMIMFGAILQLMPVLVGSAVPQARRVSAILHVLLTLGTLLLVIGLWSGYGLLLFVAIAMLALAFVGFIVAVGYALSRTQSKHPSVWAMRLALVALLLTVVIGLTLALGHGWEQINVRRWLTEIHLAWALVGWVWFLVTGVAYQVVPMFQMTPEYPASVMRLYVPIMFMLLSFWSISYFITPYLGGYLPAITVVLGVLIAAGLSAFAVITLLLQIRRRRRLSDVTLLYWRLGMLSLLVCVLIWCAGILWPEVQISPLLLGVLYIVGFVISILTGMMYKIVPFLVWLHSQRVLHERGEWRGKVPSMKEIIPERLARRQFQVQLVALVLILAAVVWPRFWIYPAAISLIAAWLMLWVNLLRGARVYRRFAVPAGDIQRKDAKT